jgi:predicted PurR-regulated permease PerM
MSRDSQPSVVAWVSAILATCLILFLFQKILWLVVPGLLALMLYYCLQPLVQALMRAGLRHGTAARLVAGVLFLATALGLVLLAPKAVERAPAWKAVTVRYIDGGLHFVGNTEKALGERFPILQKSAVFGNTELNVSAITGQFAEKYLSTLLFQFAHWLPSLLLMPYLTYFLLHDGVRFKKYLIRSVPNAFFEKTLLLFERIDSGLQNFFVGMLKLTFLDTACLGVGLWLIGVSAPMLLGLVAAVLACVPYVGSVAGCLLVVTVAATDFSGQPVITYSCILLFLSVRLLDDFVFMPLTVGRGLNIHPVLSVLMLFLGAAVAGPTGLVLVLPVVGVVLVVADTLGQILGDRCLRARFHDAKLLQHRQAPVR